MLARSSIYLQNPTASNTTPSPDLLHLSHHHLSLGLLQHRPNWSPGLPYDPCQSILHIGAIVILLEQKSWPASAQHPAVAPHFTQVKAKCDFLLHLLLSSHSGCSQLGLGHTPAPGPFHRLFPLFGIPFAQTFTWLTTAITSFNPC